MDQTVQFIPIGPKNLANIYPSIPWQDVEEYYLQITNLENVVVATTPRYFIQDGTPAEDETYRLHFLNSLGGVDAITFIQTEETYSAKGDTWQKPISFPLVKSDGGANRFNVRANESYKVTALFTESQLPWVKELLRSPSVWQEWKGTQGQPDDYLPVLLKDSNITTLKTEERYVYQLNIEYELSNSDITIRN